MSTAVQTASNTRLIQAQGAAQQLLDSSGRREEIPVRNSFARSTDPTTPPPLARLVSTHGRGGTVPVLLYLALIWRCAKYPHSTEIQARKWAMLLALPDPSTHGARRVTHALNTLEREQLVRLERRRGEATIITLLEESGVGRAYTLPSTATAKAQGPAAANHWYFKIPPQLWVSGVIQEMSAGAVAMLLVLLCERNVNGQPTWWSTTRFPELFGLSPAMRAKGTKELRSLGLLRVTKQQVPESGQAGQIFTRDRVRNLYQLAGDARPQVMRDAEASKVDPAQTRKTRAARPKRRLIARSKL